MISSRRGDVDSRSEEAVHGNLGVWPSLIVGEMIVEKLNCALKAARAEHEATMQVLRKESDALEKRKNQDGTLRR